MSINEEAKIVRRRKERVGEHLHNAHHELMQIVWIHPNCPVYLDYDQARTLRDIRRIARELLEEHDKAEEGLKAAAGRVA